MHGKRGVRSPGERENPIWKRTRDFVVPLKGYKSCFGVSTLSERGSRGVQGQGLCGFTRAAFEKKKIKKLGKDLSTYFEIDVGKMQRLCIVAVMEN